MGNLEVKEIPKDAVIPYLIYRHYARRKCPMTYCYGLFKELYDFLEKILGEELNNYSINSNKYTYSTCPTILSPYTTNPLIPGSPDDWKITC